MQSEQSHLELQILTSRMGLYPQPAPLITSDALAHSAMTTEPPNPNPTSDFTILLRGALEDFLIYSRQEHSQWLIDVAHDICDPTLKRGVLQVWDAAGEMWRNVNPADHLTASTYFYDVQAIVSLSKISERAGKSRTTATSNPSTMASRVKQRDGDQCWVTGSDHEVTNSHICPKRMGDHMLRIICATFVSTPLPETVTVYDERCGITLTRNFDASFDKYKLGMRFVALVRNSFILFFYS
jgi:hypothetical protein